MIQVKLLKNKVIVFNYELDITKIDGATKATIENAQFKLGNDKNQWATVNEDGLLYRLG